MLCMRCLNVNCTAYVYANAYETIHQQSVRIDHVQHIRSAMQTLLCVFFVECFSLQQLSSCSICCFCLHTYIFWLPTNFYYAAIRTNSIYAKAVVSLNIINFELAIWMLIFDSRDRAEFAAHRVTATLRNIVTKKQIGTILVRLRLRSWNCSILVMVGRGRKQNPMNNARKFTKLVSGRRLCLFLVLEY